MLSRIIVAAAFGFIAGVLVADNVAGRMLVSRGLAEYCADGAWEWKGECR